MTMTTSLLRKLTILIFIICTQVILRIGIRPLTFNVYLMVKKSVVLMLGYPTLIEKNIPLTSFRSSVTVCKDHPLIQRLGKPF